jgi:hypothetical protein
MGVENCMIKVNNLTSIEQVILEYDVDFDS